MAFLMLDLDDFEMTNYFEHSLRDSILFLLSTNFFFFLGSQDGSKDIKRNLFCNHPILTRHPIAGFKKQGQQ